MLSLSGDAIGMRSVSGEKLLQTGEAGETDMWRFLPL